ncbi:MAG: TMEM165/GDT1 family protein [Candidatus Thiodiazotropha endolucinida]
MKILALLPLSTIFITVFLAELGDKTQLATLLFATDKTHNPYLVFVAASLALITTTGIAVLAGSFAEKYLAVVALKLIAGIGFVAIGLWTIAEPFRG